MELCDSLGVPLRVMRVQVNWALMFCSAEGFTPVLTPDVVQSEVSVMCDV